MFWHSSAHILGEAMERVYAGHLCYGPPIEEGFYYDMFSDEYRVGVDIIVYRIEKIIGKWVMGARLGIY